MDYTIYMRSRGMIATSRSWRRHFFPPNQRAA